MKQQQFNRRTKVVFTHFSRKGYALFSVLGREVLVGVLAVSCLTHAKADGISTDTATTQDSLERKEMKLDEVVVTGSRVPLTLSESAQIVAVVTRDDIQRAAAASINDVLKLATGVDVRQRGGYGVQTDISLRGGNFDQVAILLNGVSISSPHTGHLSADFPVSVDDIERIEVLEGANASSLNGVINIITASPLAPPPSGRGMNSSVRGHAFGGSYGLAGANASTSFLLPLGEVGRGSHFASAGYTRSDGATDNSAFQSVKAYYKGDFEIKSVDLSASCAYSYKPFEANTFYGASSTDQWESNEHWLAAIKLSTPLPEGGGVGGEAFWNHWNDHYQWHRDNPVGENFHKVDMYGGNIDGWFTSVLGKTAVGAELRNEAIRSSKLGELEDETAKYSHRDSRLVLTAFLEHNILLRKWTVSPTLHYMHYWCSKSHDKGGQLMPALKVSFRPADGWRLYASWTTGMRLPTFTDLYYSGKNIEGNRLLKPEKSSDFQLGLHHNGRGYFVETNLFYSLKRDMIDWVTVNSEQVTVNSEQLVFHSVNFKQKTAGGELTAAWLPRALWGERMPLRKMQVKYSYTWQDPEYDVCVLQSKYAMEYLRHKLIIAADGRIVSKLGLSLTWSWKDRTGESNKAYSLLDARLSWDEQKWSVYCEGTNLYNTTYYDYSYIPQPGICVQAGVKLRL